MDIKGKVAVVTGGNGGLGRRISYALAKNGVDVAIIFKESDKEAEIVSEKVRSFGVNSFPFKCDISNSKDIKSMLEAVENKFHRLDILINNAAYNKWIPYSNLDKMTENEWGKMLDINLTGHFMCMKYSVPYMLKQGSGRIVNISSVAGVAPTGSSIGYAVAKSALNHLTKCMAVSVAPNILVNCVAPGFLEGTRATSNLEPSYREKAKDKSLLKKAADKNDVADQVLTFCKTDTTTGQVLILDSGRLLSY
ncbi:MAG: SDR family oxidoreductase [SAR202 cluster bacterium]|nr:SDR family oxidoreductase [SAR202 cluster bacterium]|tara:strand:- start:23214 stop:23966 length:753 start_codon:yes stop_codon:yes gene_type:complete